MNPHIKSDLDNFLTNNHLTAHTVEEINRGSNNKLYKIFLENHNTLLSKIYFARDKKVLEREYTVLSFLHSQGNTRVPQALYQNPELYYAIYSFEQGTPKSCQEITTADLDQMVLFVSDMHNIERGQVPDSILPASMACYSMQDFFKNINQRLGLVQNTPENEYHPKALEFIKKNNIIERLQSVSATIKNSIDPVAFSKNISEDNIRLSPVDFGPHNTLFRSNGDPVFVDFEYAGLDHPLRCIVEFINHDKTYELDDSKKQYFVDKYFSSVHLSSEVISSFSLINQISQIEWITIILKSITPTIIKQRHFSEQNFDLELYLDKQLTKISTRLAKYTTQSKQ